MTPFLLKTSKSALRERFPIHLVSAFFVSGAVFLSSIAHGADQPRLTLDQLMRAQAQKEQVQLSPVRSKFLKETAQTLGAQLGLIERAKEINQAIDSKRVLMENTFRFGDLVIGAGVLPPVVVETRNAASVTDTTMRLAGTIYKITQPARFFSGAPSWRDWLLMGLPSDAEMPSMPTNEQLLPRDAQERRFWEQEVRKAYQQGRKQAQAIFDHNLAQLEEVYLGMRTYYDLYQRNMVTAPTIAKSQEVLTQSGPDTIILGDTLFRITEPAAFNLHSEQWKALEARPRVDNEPNLPVVLNYDPEQVANAFRVAQEIKQRNEQREAKSKGLFTKSTHSETKDGDSQLTQSARATVPAQTGLISNDQPLAQTPLASQAIEPQHESVAPRAGFPNSDVSVPLFSKPSR